MHALSSVAKAVSDAKCYISNFLQMFCYWSSEHLVLLLVLLGLTVCYSGLHHHQRLKRQTAEATAAAEIYWQKTKSFPFQQGNDECV